MSVLKAESGKERDLKKVIRVNLQTVIESLLGKDFAIIWPERAPSPAKAG